MAKKNLFSNEEVYDGKYFNIHQDRETPIPAFFILESKRNIRSFAEFSPDESEEFMELIKKLRRGMREVLNVNDVYFFQNEDSSHFFHLWVFPRHQWMERFGRKIQSVRPIMDYAEKNMVSNRQIEEVRNAVARMKNYMKK